MIQFDLCNIDQTSKQEKGLVGNYENFEYSLENCGIDPFYKIEVLSLLDKRA